MHAVGRTGSKLPDSGIGPGSEYRTKVWYLDTFKHNSDLYKIGKLFFFKYASCSRLFLFLLPTFYKGVVVPLPSRGTS